MPTIAGVLEDGALADLVSVGISRVGKARFGACGPLGEVINNAIDGAAFAVACRGFFESTARLATVLFVDNHGTAAHFDARSAACSGA